MLAADRVDKADKVRAAPVLRVHLAARAVQVKEDLLDRTQPVVRVVQAGAFHMLSKPSQLYIPVPSIRTRT
jgi:hypothetical protein